MNDMTIRDYFAAEAMPLAMQEYRLITCKKGGAMEADWGPKYGLSVVAQMAYDFADAMIEARKRSDDGTEN